MRRRHGAAHSHSSALQALPFCLLWSIAITIWQPYPPLAMATSFAPSFPLTVLPRVYARRCVAIRHTYLRRGCVAKGLGVTTADASTTMSCNAQGRGLQTRRAWAFHATEYRISKPSRNLQGKGLRITYDQAQHPVAALAIYCTINLPMVPQER